MRAAAVTVVAGAVVASGLGASPALAMSLPDYDSAATCRFAERIAGSYPFQACMADERAALDVLATHWRDVPEAIQRACDDGQRAYRHPSPSFGGLVWCLDRELLAAGRPSPFSPFVAD